MLKNIKSSYFIDLLFLFIDEKQKLKISKYNKNLQKKLDISILNYQHFTGKYIIYESNGFGKEYDGYEDRLIFEGEYLHGERSGKGKEVDILEYEGEYLHGKRNGKGKVYYRDELRFEGEYLNNKRHGKGKEYYRGKIMFDGEYFNDLEWIGTKYDYSGNLLYTLTNDINGKGKEYFNNSKLRYEGNYLNGKRNGIGTEY